MQQWRVLEQLLLLDEIWQEGSASPPPHELMGPHPAVAFLSEWAAQVDERFKTTQAEAKAKENGQ